MHVDIGNALSAAATDGVSREDLARLDDRVGEAADRIEAGREAGERGYVALDLPERTEPDRIESAVETVAHAETLLTIGIGGSSLGAATITGALGGDGRTRFLDNVDPAHTRTVLDSLDLGSTAFNVVSRSGTTVETLSNFLVARAAMTEAGVDWTERTVVTTGGSGPLRRMADEFDLPILSVPDGVPGRFSALSPVGLFAAAFQGIDIEAVLEGGRRAEASLTDSLFDSPAYAYGATTYALERRGAAINAMMPYAEALEPFAEWFAQLWAESLGKDGRGQTPVRAMGVTDQHSQLQLYRAGPPDKVITFVRPRERPSVPLPTVDQVDIDYLEGASLEGLIGAEFEATEASLAEADVPNVRIELDAIDAAGIGDLLYGMEAACIMAGELSDVDTFSQPAVEWGKEAARGLLRGEESLPGKTRLVVEN